MEIPIEIPDEKLEEFRTYFLYLYPVPIDDKTGEPLYTQLGWFQQWIKDKLIQIYKAGKRKKILNDLDYEYDIW